tara:strand:+ start:14464 stop:22602 length:8139 start_codon:yes stop_codon:yes gene_type:complete
MAYIQKSKFKTDILGLRVLSETDFALITNPEEGMIVAVHDDSDSVSPDATDRDIAYQVKVYSQGTWNDFAIVVNGILTITAPDGEAAGIILASDEGDDVGDRWKIFGNDADADNSGGGGAVVGKLTFSNDIETAGDFVEMVSFEANAVPTDSNARFAGNVTIGGNLWVNGDTTTVNSATITVDDKNLELGSAASSANLTGTFVDGSVNVTLTSGTTTSLIEGQQLSHVDGPAFGAVYKVASRVDELNFTIDVAHTGTSDDSIDFEVTVPITDHTADGGGITLKGSSDKTINWTNATNTWNFNQGITVSSLDPDGVTPNRVAIGTTTPDSAYIMELEVASGLAGEHGMLIDMKGTGLGLVVDSSSTTQYSAKFDGKYGLYISQSSEDGKGLYVKRDNDSAETSPLVDFVDDHTSNTQTTLRVQQDGTGDILNLFDDTTEVFTVEDGGNVISTPASGGYIKVDDADDDGYSHLYGDGKLMLFHKSDTPTDYPFVSLKRNRDSNPYFPQAGDNQGVLQWRAYPWNNNIASIHAEAEETYSATSQATKLVFSTCETTSNTPTERMTIKGSGNIGIGTDSPGTLLQLEGADAYLTLKNETDENTDGGAETKIIFEDHSNTTLGQIEVSHHGESDDTKGQIVLSANDGTSVEEVLRLDSDKLATFAGDLTVVGNTILEGNLTVDGTVTAINSTTLSVDDKNIELAAFQGVLKSLGADAFVSNTLVPSANWVGNQIHNDVVASSVSAADSRVILGNIRVGIVTNTSGSSVQILSVVQGGQYLAAGDTITFTEPGGSETITAEVHSTGVTSAGNDISADGGGITVKATTDKTFNWVASSDAWTTSTDLDIGTGVLKSPSSMSFIIDHDANGNSEAFVWYKDGTSTDVMSLAEGGTLTVGGNAVDGKIQVKTQSAIDAQLELMPDGAHADKQWKFKADRSGVLTVESSINSGTFAPHLTITANATPSNSTTAVAGNLNIGGNLVVNGLTTTVNSTELTVDDKNIELSSLTGVLKSVGSDALVANTVSTSAAWNPVDTTYSDGVVATSISAADPKAVASSIKALIVVDASGANIQITNFVQGGHHLAPGDTITFTDPGSTSNTATVTVKANGTGSFGNDLTADGGGIVLKAATNKELKWVNATNRWTTNVGLNVVGDMGVGINGYMQLADNQIGITSGNLTLDVAGNIELNADGGQIDFKDDGVSLMQLTDAGLTFDDATTISTVDVASSVAHLTFDADGDINLEPGTGNQVLIDGTIAIDAGVVTGATSITSGNFIGAVGNYTQNTGAFTTCDATTNFTVGSTVITDSLIVMTPDPDDTVTIEARNNGALSITTVDTAGEAADIVITADGLFKAFGATIELESKGDIELNADSGTITMKDDSATLFTFTADEIDVPSGDLTIDVHGNIELNADGGTISFKDDTRELANFGGTGVLTILGAEGLEAGIILQGDEGDDAGDSWKLHTTSVATAVGHLDGAGTIIGITVYGGNGYTSAPTISFPWMQPGTVPGEFTTGLNGDGSITVNLIDGGSGYPSSANGASFIISGGRPSSEPTLVLANDSVSQGAFMPAVHFAKDVLFLPENLQVEGNATVDGILTVDGSISGVKLSSLDDSGTPSTLTAGDVSKVVQVVEIPAIAADIDFEFSNTPLPNGGMDFQIGPVYYQILTTDTGVSDDTWTSGDGTTYATAFSATINGNQASAADNAAQFRALFTNEFHGVGAADYTVEATTGTNVSLVANTAGSAGSWTNINGNIQVSANLTLTNTAGVDAIYRYNIDNVDLTLGTAADSGTGSVNTSQDLTLTGGAGITTSAANQTITTELSAIDDMRVLANVSGGAAAPSPIEIDTDLAGTSGSHDTLTTALAVKTYVDNSTPDGLGQIGDVDVPHPLTSAETDKYLTAVAIPAAKSYLIWEIKQPVNGQNNSYIQIPAGVAENNHFRIYADGPTADEQLSFGAPGSDTSPAQGDGTHAARKLARIPESDNSNVALTVDELCQKFRYVLENEVLITTNYIITSDDSVNNDLTFPPGFSVTGGSKYIMIEAKTAIMGDFDFPDGLEEGAHQSDTAYFEYSKSDGSNAQQKYQLKTLNLNTLSDVNTPTLSPSDSGKVVGVEYVAGVKSVQQFVWPSGAVDYEGDVTFVVSGIYYKVIFSSNSADAAFSGAAGTSVDPKTLNVDQGAGIPSILSTMEVAFNNEFGSGGSGDYSITRDVMAVDPFLKMEQKAASSIGNISSQTRNDVANAASLTTPHTVGSTEVLEYNHVDIAAAGSNMHIQFNDGSGFAGESEFTYDSSDKLLHLKKHTTTAESSPGIRFTRTQGTSGSPSSPVDNDHLGSIQFYGYDDNESQSAFILALADGDHGTIDNPASFTLIWGDGAPHDNEFISVYSEFEITANNDTTKKIIIKIEPPPGTSDESFQIIGNDIELRLYENDTTSVTPGFSGAAGTDDLEKQIHRIAYALNDLRSNPVNGISLANYNEILASGAVGSRTVVITATSSNTSTDDFTYTEISGSDSLNRVTGTPVDGNTVVDTSDSPGALVFATTPEGSGANPTPRMTIKNDGRVGIGTTTPSATLEVVGDIQVAGKITNVTNPTAAQDAATKAYVDASSSGVTNQVNAIQTTSLSADISLTSSTSVNNVFVLNTADQGSWEFKIPDLDQYADNTRIKIVNASNHDLIIGKVGTDEFRCYQLGMTSDQATMTLAPSQQALMLKDGDASVNNWWEFVISSL